MSLLWNYARLGLGMRYSEDLRMRLVLSGNEDQSGL